MNYDIAIDVAIDSTENITVIGTVANANSDQFLVQYDAEGNERWNDTRDGGNYETGEAVITNGTDIYITNHYHNQTSNQRECFLAKYDSAGNRLWNTSWIKNGA